MYAYAMSCVALIHLGCGGSQAQRALVAAAAFTAVEVAASAMEAAANEARARDAAKQARQVARKAPTGNWRLVRSEREDNCDAPRSEAEEEDCEARIDDNSEDAIETNEEDVSIGKCMVCE